MLPLPGDAVLLGDIVRHIQKRGADGKTDPSFADGGEVPYSTYLDDAGAIRLTVGLPLAAAPDGAFAAIAVRDALTHVLVVFDANGKPRGPLRELPFAKDQYNDGFMLAIAADGSIYVEHDPVNAAVAEIARFAP